MSNTNGELDTWRESKVWWRTWDKSYGVESQGGCIFRRKNNYAQSLCQLVWVVMMVATGGQKVEQTEMLVWTTWYPAVAVVASPTFSHPQVWRKVGVIGAWELKGQMGFFHKRLVVYLFSIGLEYFHPNKREACRGSWRMLGARMLLGHAKCLWHNAQRSILWLLGVWLLKIYSKVQHFFVVSSLFFVVVNICVVSDSSKGFLVLVLLMIITTLKPCLHLGFTFHMVFSITMSSSSMVLQVLLSYITHIVTYDIHFNLCK